MENQPSPDEILPTEKHKGEFTYYYYFAYYPTRYEVTEEYKQRRKIVWAFKDGHNSIIIADDFAKDLNYFKLSKPISKWWLCVIPASTKEKTELRFKAFCERLCSRTSLNNGYELIMSKSDRLAKHRQGEEGRNAIDILESIEFGNVRGRNILLFDDLYTTGKSFLHVARRLKALGAEEVKGLFLGKTHWLVEENNHKIDDINEKTTDILDDFSFRMVDSSEHLSHEEISEFQSLEELGGLEEGSILKSSYPYTALPSKIELLTENNGNNLYIIESTAKEYYESADLLGDYAYISYGRDLTVFKHLTKELISQTFFESLPYYYGERLFIFGVKACDNNPFLVAIDSGQPEQDESFVFVYDWREKECVYIDYLEDELCRKLIWMDGTLIYYGKNRETITLLQPDCEDGLKWQKRMITSKTNDYQYYEALIQNATAIKVFIGNSYAYEDHPIDGSMHYDNGYFEIIVENQLYQFSSHYRLDRDIFRIWLNDEHNKILMESSSNFYMLELQNAENLK